MATPQLDVYLPDGSVQSYPLTDERVVVGTATRCLVVIDRPEFAPEHLLLSPRPDGVWVAVARGVTTPTLLDGEPFERGMVGWGRALTVGPVRLGLNDGSKVHKKADGDGAKKEEKVSPVLLVAAAIIIPFALYSSFSPNNAAPPSRIGTEAPALFDDPLARACPATDPALTRQSAEESTRVALSKAERMPFRMQDGVEAVLYYTQAASCYAAAGDAPSAEQATRRAAGLKNRLEDEYRAHRFRLERALEQGRTEDALFEVRMITAMVSHRRGQYRDALAALERQLTLRLDQAQAAQR
ncbi:MAG: hypothetical protein JWM10_4219 [Myxococcaceae bacterium]|nr:hypothetical protein [Myxococcaceae bacterium]